MLNREIKKKVYYEGEFDASRILQEIQRIQNSFNNLNFNKTNSKTFENNLNSITKKVESMSIRLEQGFSSSKEAEQFKKEVVSVNEEITKITRNMQKFVQYAKFSDLNTDAFKEDLKTLENTINSTKQNVTDLQTQISGVLREQSGGSLSVQELKSLTKNITNLEQFQKIQQDILKNRESNYQAETNRLEELQKQTEELRKQLQLQKQAIENPGDTNNQINKYRERRDNYQQRIDKGEQLNFGEQMAYEQAKREYNRLTDTSGLQEQIKQNEVGIGNYVYNGKVGIENYNLGGVQIVYQGNSVSAQELQQEKKTEASRLDGGDEYTYPENIMSIGRDAGNSVRSGLKVKVSYNYNLKKLLDIAEKISIR